MAIFVITNQPRKLLEDLKKEINDKKIDTWLYDNDGDFYHVPNQWKFKAWLSPFMEGNRLVFGIIGQKEINLSTLAYAVYHGRFVEMLLNHFDQQFSEVNISSQKRNMIDSKKNKRLIAALLLWGILILASAISLWKLQKSVGNLMSVRCFLM